MSATARAMACWPPDLPPRASPHRRRARAPSGLLRGVQRRRPFRRRRACSRTGERRWDIEAPGIAIKQYPCCQHASGHRCDGGSRHRARPLAGDGRSRRLLDASAPPQPHQPPRPAQRARCEFLVQYVVARGLQRRRVVLSDFNGSAHDEPEIRELMGRIHAAPHPQMDMASTEHFGSEIRLHLKDGRVVSGTTDRPLGRGPTKPLPIRAWRASSSTAPARPSPPKSPSARCGRSGISTR